MSDDNTGTRKASEPKDDDEGMTEAMLRDADLELNPSLGMSLEQLDRRVKDRRG